VAVCAALLLISRGGSSNRDSSNPDSVELKGSTTRGEPVLLTVIDGRVEAFEVQVGANCPAQRLWHGWTWAAHGPFGGVGKRFEYGDRNSFPEGGRFISVMRGRLIGDDRARGSIDTRGTWPLGGGRTPCQSSILFEAAKAG
jgi:hypothetical protein